MRTLAFLLAICALGAGCAAEPAGPATHVGDWRDQVIYQIVVDRFDDADPDNDTIDGIGPDRTDLARFQGGDWRGVERRLDYIARLGATTIWISPPYRNVPRTEREDGYHGYWPADFLEPNPRLGSLDELRSLVRAAHARGMLVILDVVPNHAGRVFTYDLDRDGQVDPGEIEPPWSGEVPYDAPLLFTDRPRMLLDGAELTLEARHFHRRGFGDLGVPMQKELGDFPTGLRDLDTENDEVVRALIETHAWWVEQTDVDGFRIDAVPHAARDFWARFCGGLREALAAIGKHRFLMVGEVFSSDPVDLASYAGLHALDSAFAFDLKWDLIDAVILEGRAPELAIGALVSNRSFFPLSGQPLGVDLSPWDARVAFADNHDVWRLRGELDDPYAAELALTVVFTVDAIPAIYYGTEQGLAGQSHHEAREPLWLGAGFDESAPMYRFIQRLAEIRRRSLALRRGEVIVRYASTVGARDAEAEDASFLAYERAYEGERLLVAMNAGATDASRARMQTGFPGGTRLVDALGRASAPWVVQDGGVLDITLPPRSVVVLEPQ